MRFTLLGFDQDAGVRIYAYQGIMEGVRTTFTVGVDLSLMQRFGIQIQELPLLCRGLLERQLETEGPHALTLTGTEMRVYAENCAIARESAARGRKRPRTPAN